MRKYVKILFLLTLIIMVAFTFSTNVNAAEGFDDSGYEDLDDGTEITLPTNNEEKSKEENKDDDKNKAPETPAIPEKTEPKEPATPTDVPKESHPQAGAFTNSTVIALGGIATIGLLVGYKKMKKYNY